LHPGCLSLRGGLSVSLLFNAPFPALIITYGDDRILALVPNTALSFKPGHAPVRS
jgi:hypothetical protein